MKPEERYGPASIYAKVQVEAVRLLRDLGVSIAFRDADAQRLAPLSRHLRSRASDDAVASAA